MFLFRRRVPTVVQDAALAVFVALMQVQGTRQVLLKEGVPLSFTDHAVTGALLAGSGLVLVLRRRFPGTVLAVVGAASMAYYLGGYPDGPTWLALFVAAYTFTAYGDGPRTVRVALVGMHVVIVVWLLTADFGNPGELGWLMFRIGTTVMAITLGESVRMRRVLAVQAQERAERAERTREEEARRRVDAERLRIAREVHDTVAHAIAIINVQAGVTAHVLDKRPEQARATLRTIEQTSARALRELRATLGVLTDVSDDHRSPTPGLEQLDELVGRAEAAGLEVSVEMPERPGELPSALDSAAYRILQESITNVIRHAGPSRVTIALRVSGDDLRIAITDDGKGAPPAADCGGGRGIAGMRERCELLGGWLSAGPRPGGGFEVRALLPLRPDLVPAK
ncbi:sensor histidine kinase [Allorhizocola rhizosphaerae]|uniref:sensor histidine kinase n=1 Tax=Allorhizocola rhizosphaerae TaxID=1872709 RepID=UPI000E3C59BD|nr:sensor histidine kinase [Allorhizocola rhizosphaerae]